MRRQFPLAFFGMTGLSLFVAAQVWGQADPAAIAPPPPVAPPAVAAPGGRPDVDPRVETAKVPVAVAQTTTDLAALRTEIRRTLAELARLSQEVEALEETTPVPPNADALRQRALTQIRASWKAAIGRAARLPEEDRSAYSQAIAVWDRDVVTSKDLVAAVDAIPVTDQAAAATAAAVVPTEVPLKTKTVEAVSALLARPNDAMFPAEWGGAFDETVDRYIFDEVIEMRDAQGLFQIVPFRAEWAYADRAWHLAFLRVDGEVSIDRRLKSVIPVGERPALVYVDRQPVADRVAVGAGKAVSDLKGAYLGYRSFLQTSRTWTLADGSTFQAKLLEAGSRGRGILVTVQAFDQPKSVVPLVKFSQADQDYVVAWMNETPASVTPTISLP